MCSWRVNKGKQALTAEKKRLHLSVSIPTLQFTVNVDLQHIVLLEQSCSDQCQELQFCILGPAWALQLGQALDVKHFLWKLPLSAANKQQLGL